jgi:hypothetical protein
LEAFSAGEPVGVARYVTRNGEPRTADVTVRVVGGYQDTELALLLAERIADQAAEAGTTELVYHVPGSGRRVLDLLWAVGAIPVFEHGRLTGRGPAPLSGQAAA